MEIESQNGLKVNN